MEEEFFQTPSLPSHCTTTYTSKPHRLTYVLHMGTPGLNRISIESAPPTPARQTSKKQETDRRSCQVHAACWDPYATQCKGHRSKTLDGRARSHFLHNLPPCRALPSPRPHHTHRFKTTNPSTSQIDRCSWHRSRYCYSSTIRVRRNANVLVFC